MVLVLWDLPAEDEELFALLLARVFAVDGFRVAVLPAVEGLLREALRALVAEVFAFALGVDFVVAGLAAVDLAADGLAAVALAAVDRAWVDRVPEVDAVFLVAGLAVEALGFAAARLPAVLLCGVGMDSSPCEIRCDWSALLRRYSGTP